MSGSEPSQVAQQIEASGVSEEGPLLKASRAHREAIIEHRRAHDAWVSAHNLALDRWAEKQRLKQELKGAEDRLYEAVIAEAGLPSKCEKARDR
jgi:hypothetical protein